MQCVSDSSWVFVRYPIRQPMSLKPIQIPSVTNNPWEDSSRHQVGSCTLPCERWNQNTDLWNLPIWNSWLWNNWDNTLSRLIFFQSFTEGFKFLKTGVNSMGLFCSLVRHCTMIITVTIPVRQKSKDMLKVQTGQKSEYDPWKTFQGFTQWDFFVPWANTILH